MLHNIMVSDKEFVGIMLMGAKAKTTAAANGNGGENSHSGIDGLAVMLEVVRPGAEILKTLNSYINSGNFAVDFKKNYEIGVECALADALWDCQSRLSVCNTKFGPKDVFLMTCNDSSDVDVAVRRQACKRAEALMQELLLAAHPMIRDFEAEAEKFAASNIDQVPGAALTRSSFNRHQFRLDWTIADGVVMTVLLYSNFRSQDVYEGRKIVQLDQRTNVRVTGKLSYFDNDTGGIVTYKELYKGLKIDDRSAIFTTSEHSQIRNLYAPGMQLLGFKPLSSVILEDFIRPGVLIQPDDFTRAGNTIFHAMLRRCLARQLVPVCRIVLRNGTSARLVYLLPQEQGDESLGPLGVAGFQAHYAPFAGECRSCGLDQEELEASQEQIGMATKIAKKLVIGNFDLADYRNPTQRTYFSGVEALALDYEQAIEVVDPVVADSASAMSQSSSVDPDEVSESGSKRGRGSSRARGSSSSSRGSGRGRGRRGAGSSQ
ncbi:hypothetical protein B566_EDAN006000 [Ephemera danica]|nr:hypothetical protein B566_EDAN006000 [Ephemera danica]